MIEPGSLGAIKNAIVILPVGTSADQKVGIGYRAMQDGHGDGNKRLRGRDLKNFYLNASVFLVNEEGKSSFVEG